jgi:hypothetical protein
MEYTRLIPDKTIATIEKTKLLSLLAMNFLVSVQITPITLRRVIPYNFLILLINIPFLNIVCALRFPHQVHRLISLPAIHYRPFVMDDFSPVVKQRLSVSSFDQK